MAMNFLPHPQIQQTTISRGKKKSTMIRTLFIATICFFSHVLILGGPALAIDPKVVDTDITFEDLKDHLLNRYTPMVQKIAAGEEAGMNAVKRSALQPTTTTEKEVIITPWWNPNVSEPLSGLSTTLPGQIPQLFAQALDHSSQIKVFADLPLLRRTTIQEADGEFDTHFFADGYVSETDEPVGDELKTGGPDRYEEESSGVSFGVRRKFLPGTTIELEQEFNRYDNNSEYLTPHDQSRTRTGVKLTQPLLKGFGPTYNSAAENLAKIDASSADKELSRQMNGHLLEIVRAYWSLYMERSIYLQKDRLATKTEDLFNKMQERVTIDVQPSLLARAKSQMQSHKLDADEAKFAILNAQSRIWALVNDPSLLNNAGVEFVTRQIPIHTLPDERMLSILETALANRPEVEQSIHQLQAAVLRHYRTKNELWPELDLYAEAYTKGLQGDYDDGAAFEQQWDEGDPSYTIGLRFDFPLFNNAARARMERKEIEIRQLLNQLETTVSNVLLEAQVSYREMVKNHMAMTRRFEVMKSTEEEIADLINRIDILLAKSQEYGTILYQLLDALERLNDSEQQFSLSELTYNYSLYKLRSAQGVLLADNKVTIVEEELNDVPVNLFQILGVTADDSLLKTE